MKVRAAAQLLLVASLLGGCARRPPEATPEGAVRLWLERMEASADSTNVAKDVYASFGPDTRGDLEERAHRATQLTGRRVEPWEMIATGWFGLRFRSHTMRTHTVGERASVDVLGAFPETEHAVVQLSREAGLWKVELGKRPPETR